MSALRIAVGYLYPDVMSGYGDSGNLAAIRRRCSWRGIDTDITELGAGDLVPSGLDLIMIGGGSDTRQRLVAPDLYRVKGAAIRDALADGAAALAVGGGYELFGRFCQPERGAESAGIEVFDSWTIRRSAIAGPDERPTAVPRANRAIGELVIRWNGTLLTGFENHGGDTYLGPAAQPLGDVLAGYGNNGSGTEGVIRGSAVGTNLRGPCLPGNPALADFLIAAAVARRHSDAELIPLPDELELAARDVAVQRGLAVRPATPAAARTARRRLAGRLGRAQRSRPGQMRPARDPLRPARKPAAGDRP